MERRLLFASIPLLHSHISSIAKIYLDFDGQDTFPNWLGSDVPATPAFDRDGNVNSFTNPEIAAITEIWKRVSEKYSPFNIDVTTEDPGNRNDRQTAHCVIGGDGAWLGVPAGGVSGLGGFYSATPNTNWVFSENLPNSKDVAEAVAHECGHIFGLEHHSLFDATGTKSDEYDPGNFLVAPIMGVSYDSVRGLWNKGPSSPGATIIQDDLAIVSDLATNAFGYRADDYGGNLFSATVLTPASGAINASGVIEKSTDVDAFKVTVNNGSFNLTLSPAAVGPMLDATLTLSNAFGNVIKRSATSSLGETLQAFVSAGTYLVSVSSAGGYGDLGQYTLSGTVPGGGIPPSMGHYLIEGTDFDDNISVTLVEGAYNVDVNGEITTLDSTAITQFDILAGGGNDRVTLGPGVCAMYCLGGAGNDSITGGDFNDTITGSGGNDLIFGGLGDDRLAGSAGSDNILGGAGRDRLYGDDGNDILDGGSSGDRAYGGAGHDILVGQGGNDKLYGDDGNDSIYGGDGDDLLNGGAGLDYLYGFDGNDSLYARDTESDYVNGGPGTDTAQLDVDTTLATDSPDGIEQLLA